MRIIRIIVVAIVFFALLKYCSLLVPTTIDDDFVGTYDYGYLHEDETVQDVLRRFPGVSNVPKPNMSKIIRDATKQVFFDGNDPVNEVESSEFKILRVIDGDTVSIDIDGIEERVRLLLIDTPELNDKEYGLQPYALDAKEYVADLVENKKVLINFGLGKDRTGRDAYGRLLGYLYDEQGRMVNELLLEEGLARVAYVFEPDTEYAEAFRAIEKKAQQNKVGIWGIEGYVKSDGFHGSEGGK